MLPSTRFWQPGDPALLRGVIDKRVWPAESVIVVKDELDETDLAQLPGAECVYPEGYFRRKSGDSCGIRRWQEAKQEVWDFQKFS